MEEKAGYVDWALNMADREKDRAITLTLVSSFHFLLVILGTWLQIPSWFLFVNMMAGIMTGGIALISWIGWKMWKRELNIWLNSILGPQMEES